MHDPTDPVLAWHFCGDTLRDGRPIPPDGEKLVHEGELEICASGLHASERLIDALRYAPGKSLCRVAVGGKIVRGGDKLCGTERIILWRLDAEPVLREFARWAALQVIHLWEAPEVVREYLETGDENLRAAAEAAARAAAEAAARAAGAAVARAAGDAARAARAAARAAWAAWAADWAAWAADWAAWAVARAAGDAARAAGAGAEAARAAAGDARAAAGDAQNDKLSELVLAAHEARSAAA